ncbi:hypothetical protein NQ317_000084 [Molorchus minor]|uniref:Uncharacterized protein n=1 Tax=Molorchus minor TaxID=1323400 RepID=A0ABQ9IYR3_9CUCU|nr:hypothetical protein NQ317_000084 [Molorchus minor]
MAMLDILLNAKENGLVDDEGIQNEVNTFMVEELIIQEINQVLGESNDQPTFHELQESKYLERVLEEDIVTRVGYVLPKDAIINIHIYDVHRDPEVVSRP